MARSPRNPSTFAAGLIKAFYRLLSSYEASSSSAPLVAPEALEQLRSLAPATRIPAEPLQSQLANVVQLSGDPDLGLKAGKLFDLEDAGILSSAACSAATLRDAMATAARAMRMVTDSVTYRVVHRGSRTEAHLESKGPLPRAAADFLTSALRSHHRRTHSFDLPGIEWSFPYPAPASIQEHKRTFGPVPIHFDAEYLGYSIDASYLDLPLRTADARQHDFLTRQIDHALARDASAATVLRCVREAIARDLGNDQLAVEHVAHSLQMSPRTLARRLQEEGTSFRCLVSDARKRQALHYLSATDHTIADIASMLGFSDVAAFYRAFRRWMRTTPVAFRTQARSAAAAEPLH